MSQFGFLNSNNVFKPSINVPSNFQGVQIGNTGYFVDPSGGTASNLAGDVKPLSDFYGQEVIGLDGKTATLNNPNAMSWTQGLGYGLAGLQTLTGLANAYLGYKNYKLAKDQFGFEKAAINRNIANQAKQINSAYDSSASIAAAMQGTDANGVLRPEVRERYMNEAKNRHVDGSRIG